MSAKMNMSVMRKILTGRGVLLALIAVARVPVLSAWTWIVCIVEVPGNPWGRG